MYIRTEFQAQCYLEGTVKIFLLLYAYIYMIKLKIVLLHNTVTYKCCTLCIYVLKLMVAHGLLLSPTDLSET